MALPFSLSMKLPTTNSILCIFETHHQFSRKTFFSFVIYPIVLGKKKWFGEIVCLKTEIVSLSPSICSPLLP